MLALQFYMAVFGVLGAAVLISCTVASIVARFERKMPASSDVCATLARRARADTRVAARMIASAEEMGLPEGSPLTRAHAAALDAATNDTVADVLDPSPCEPASAGQCRQLQLILGDAAPAGVPA